MRHFFSAGITLLCLFGCVNAWAQPSIGIKLGMGLSTPAVTVTPNTYDNWTPETKSGAVFGLFTQVPLRGNWVFAPAALLASKGFKERHVSATYNYDFAIPSRFFYLDVPLNFIHSSKPKGNGFQIGGGPVASYLVDKEHRSYGVKSLDFGVNGLVGYQTPIGFSVQLNYTFGLVNVGESSSQVPNIKNRFLAFSVGYLF